jgi:hypothetical protein
MTYPRTCFKQTIIPLFFIAALDLSLDPKYFFTLFKCSVLNQEISHQYKADAFRSDFNVEAWGPLVAEALALSPRQTTMHNMAAI